MFPFLGTSCICTILHEKQTILYIHVFKKKNRYPYLAGLERGHSPTTHTK